MPDTIDEKTEQIEFFGKEITLNQITNPHLRRVITDRRAKGYNNHSKHYCHSEHTEWSGDHREKYHEYSIYSNYTIYYNSCNFPDTDDDEKAKEIKKELIKPTQS